MTYTTPEQYLARRDGIENWMHDACAVDAAIRGACKEIERRIRKGDLTYDERQILVEGAVKALAGVLVMEERRVKQQVGMELRRSIGNDEVHRIINA